MFPSACRGRDIAGVGRGWVMQRWVWMRRCYRERKEGAWERSFWAVWGGEGGYTSPLCWAPQLTLPATAWRRGAQVWFFSSRGFVTMDKLLSLLGQPCLLFPVCSMLSLYSLPQSRHFIPNSGIFSSIASRMLVSETNGDMFFLCT